MSMASLSTRPLARLRRRAYSLWRARFFAASLAASPPALARPPVFTPPSDLRAPTLERTRGAGASTDGPVDCAPAFAMTRVREMRGFFAMRPFGRGGTAVGMRDGLASAVAAAVSDVWYTGLGHF